ncbi:MAG TPA: hypothetical protein VFX12_16100 [Vicinamibacterales bacterium]|nr:hypothetical protein [Vicinamibacterales bacterium]
MSIILSLVGSRISDDCLTRSGDRQVVRISGKDLVRIYGTRMPVEIELKPVTEKDLEYIRKVLMYERSSKLK